MEARVAYDEAFADSFVHSTKPHRGHMRTVSDPRHIRHHGEASLTIRMHMEPGRAWSTPGHRGKIRDAVEQAAVGTGPNPESSREAWNDLYQELRHMRPKGGGWMRMKWRNERLIPWSVVAVELLITLLFVGFATITFWFGTWQLLDLSFAALFPDHPHYSIGATIGLGSFILVLAVVVGRLGLSRIVYKPLWPSTWSELISRTLIDRLLHYVQSWGSLCIWKGVWDLWGTQILIVDSRWATAAVAHVVGLVILLLCFAFRGAALPPMVYVEDNIMQDTMMSRWNVISQLIWRHKKGPIQRDWETNKIHLTPELSSKREGD